MTDEIKQTNEKGAGVMPAPPGLRPEIARLIEELARAAARRKDRQTAKLAAERRAATAHVPTTARS